MISLTNYDFQWARSELVIIYPDSWDFLAYKACFSNIRSHEPHTNGTVDGAKMIKSANDV